jgi:glycosyltransferase involved in cell wall biosynthesis
MSIILKKIIQYVVRNAYFITSDSQYMSREIVRLGGREDRIFTFPMGVEEGLIQYKHVYNDDNALRIISTRRLEDLYNIDVIIKGFHKALMENENIYLTIAADGSKMESLEAMVDSLGINNKIKFTGRYNPGDIGKLLVDNDVFISIPQSDSTSVSLLEGMYCGLFSIVSDLPANREWINNKDNGIIVKSADEDHVKESILWCYENREHIKAVSNKNTDIIKERALWKNNAKIVEGLYEELITLNR